MVRAGEWRSVWLSVSAARMWCVSKGQGLRRIADPVVAVRLRGCGSGPGYSPRPLKPRRWSRSGSYWVRCIGASWPGGSGWAAWTARLTHHGARSVSRPSRRYRHRGGPGRSPGRWRINTSWGCGAWWPKSRICAPRSRCLRLGAYCVPASLRRSPTATPSAGRVAGLGGIATPRSGSLRLDVWRYCGAGWRLLKRQ